MLVGNTLSILVIVTYELACLTALYFVIINRPHMLFHFPNVLSCLHLFHLFHLHKQVCISWISFCVFFFSSSIKLLHEYLSRFSFFFLFGTVWYHPGMGARRGVSKEVEDGRRSPALRVGHPWNSHKAVSGVACPQGVEGSGMAGPGETLGSPWPPIAIRLWYHPGGRALGFCLHFPLFSSPFSLSFLIFRPIKDP
jgi:hypothetical protein